MGSAGDHHRDRERARAPGPHRRPPRGHAGPAAGARGSRRRPDLQHRGGRRGPQPRGPGARRCASCSASRTPARDSATLAIALDKALGKKVLLQHDILTPKFQLMESARERLSPDMKFPLIVKPNAEGSSKGIDATNVVDTEEELRAAVKLLRRAVPPAGARRGVHRRPRVHGRPARRQAAARAAADGDQVQEGRPTRPVYDYGGQAGVGGARLLRVPRAS